MKTYQGSNIRAYLILLVSMTIGWSIGAAFDMDANLSWADNYEEINLGTLFGIIIGLTIGALAFRDRKYRVEITNRKIVGPKGYEIWKDESGIALEKDEGYRIKKGFFGYWTPFYDTRIVQGRKKIKLSAMYFSRKQIDEIIQEVQQVGPYNSGKRPPLSPRPQT